MNKTTLILLVVLLVAGLIGYLVFGAKGSQKSETGTLNSIEQEAGQIEKKIETGGVVAPKNLLKCDPKYFTEICLTDRKQTICDYYKQITSDGKETIENVERTNICIYCKWYGEKGVLQAGSKQMITLGYEEKPCYQGMYKGQ